MLPFEQKTEVQAISLKSIYCLLTDKGIRHWSVSYEETNGSYPFVNGLNGLWTKRTNGLAHLWLKVIRFNRLDFGKVLLLVFIF